MTELSREDFEARFVAEMMTYASVYAGPENELRDYAVSAAPSYFDEHDQRADGPEECARADVGYWEE